MKVKVTDKLYQYRVENKLSRKELSHRTYVSEKTIQRAEEGKNISLHSAKLISKGTGIDLKDLIISNSEDKNNDDKQMYRSIESREVIYSKLGMKNYTNLDNINITKVRYMGRSAPILLNDGDKLNMYFYTTGMNSSIYECKVDISMPTKESIFLMKVDSLYENYKDKPLQISPYNRSNLKDFEIEAFNRKIISLRLGDEVSLRVIGDQHAELHDFYPKAKPVTDKEINSLIQELIYIIKNNQQIELTNSIIPIGWEAIDKVLRCCVQYNKKNPVREFLDKYIDKFMILKELFALLSYVFISYLDGDLCEKDATGKINEVYKQIAEYLDLLITLYKKQESYMIEKRLMHNI